MIASHLPPAGLAICALALAGVAADPACARKKVAPAQVDAWAACAVENNSGDVKWMYILRSEQSGLEGRAFDGAGAHAVFLIARDCVPEGTSFDNPLINSLSTAAFSLWARDIGKDSAPRSIDPWADCMVEHHPEKARAYLYARDFSFGGPKIMVDGVDPTTAIFDPAPECDSVRPSAAETKWADLYARLNYLIRVKPRPVSLVARDAHGDKR
jgi:hypothetical protein